MDLPALQPLIVTPDWQVAYHQFFAIDPSRELVEGDELWFKQDMYQARNGRRDRLIDLGWYPEGDFDGGSFGLVLYQGDFRGELLSELRSKDRCEIVATMNQWFASVSNGAL